MNITYIIGLVGAIVVILLGMAGPTLQFGNVVRFFDFPSIMITVGCTLFVVVASFPAKMLKNIPKHFKIILNDKGNDPAKCIDELVDLAQTARKSGLLSLEEKAAEQEDPFFKQAIMMIIDVYDADKIRDILENDVECMSARHENVAAMYDKASAVAPAFGMVGTLVGLINMLKNMTFDSGGTSTLGNDMGTALITTLYGCVLAHMLFGPIASLLRTRDEEEVLYKMIIVEGVMGIQAGENPKFLRDHLMTYMAQKRRELGEEGEAPKGKKGKKGKEE